ncbi:MAG TPA: hypothetical protein VM282_25070 [Acidimicrobiales bacterium]|nr:hypothetical protein [Acidimicrobiales bacterium]
MDSRDARCLISSSPQSPRPSSLTVLHYDEDFDHVAAVTGQPTQWIVERGSID